jgi:hypothetical protein
MVLVGLQQPDLEGREHGQRNYELLSQHSGLALGVPAATSGSGSSALLNGTGLDQETVTGAADQLWSFYN